MWNKHAILKGTFILTITGLISRMIGFLFRIFLSHHFTEEQIGLYQLIFPLYGLCYSLSTAGIEVAISRCIAKYHASKNHPAQKQILSCGLGLSCLLSILCTLFLQSQASTLATRFLHDSRCVPLLIGISYALPFASVHSCICGYYYGLKQTKKPAFSMLFEQVCRVVGVMLLCVLSTKIQKNPSILCAILGMVIGEFFSMVYCVLSLKNTRILNFTGNCDFRKDKQQKGVQKPALFELLHLAVPLTTSRILFNVLQSVESISIPHCLHQYGYTTSESLSIYGVLTGMAMPCILFPSAITNSLSTMLLPSIAEITPSHHRSQLKQLCQKVIPSCLCLGWGCCIIFLLFGRLFGNLLFHSTLAGDFLLVLAWICPFLYTNSTLMSILNGLGKPTLSFFINICGLSLRILSIYYGIPSLGMMGYLFGLLASQLLITFLGILVLVLHIRRSS